MIAVIETSVGVYATDADHIDGELELRQDTRGRLEIADDRGRVAELFGDVLPERAVTPATTRTLLFAVQVPGVPDIHVEEALWLVEEILT